MKKLGPMITFLFFLIDLGLAQDVTTAVNIGVVLDLNTTNSNMSLLCMNMSLSEFYVNNYHYKTRLVLHIEDSKGDVVGAAAAALKLIQNNEVKAIVGPGYSMQAPFVIQLGSKSHVPIVSFAATSPTLTSIRSPYFIRATQNDSSQVKAIAAIVKAFGWREVVPIYVDNEFGEGIIPHLADALEKINTRISYRSVISPLASGEEIAQELYKLMTMQSRVFIVHMLPADGANLMAKAKEIGMLKQSYAWILTNGMTDQLTLLNETNLESMEGVLGLKTYVPKSKELEQFIRRWKQKTSNAELNIFGLWAYDAITALAMAVEKANNFEFGFHKTNMSGNAMDLEAVGVSKVGPSLLQALSETRFNGLAGEFQLINGQLHTSTFQIVNVNGNGERLIGFWTQRDGLVRSFSTTNAGTYSARKDNLKPIIWPGETTTVPKGWEIPSNGKKLQIGVPKKDGFTEFVKVGVNQSTNKTEITGFCIDLFDAVMQAMPYAVDYEYISFELPDGKPAGTYDDLVYQVYLEGFFVANSRLKPISVLFERVIVFFFSFVMKYDIVVGDTTILANRSFYVDFTLPFTESGVTTVVPLIDKKKKQAWVFLQPLSGSLWATILCSFIFVALVVWILEYRTNDEFRDHIGTTLWFSFSTMIFAHKEKVVSNATRFVVIIWCFVVLILTQSYTASLASLLTAQQLQPKVYNIQDLVRNGEKVAYQRGSFVLAKLKQLGFDDTQLVTYNTHKQLDELFSKGTANGGISAAFDEVPYMKLFLGIYCPKYTVVEPTFKADGFGFVFPIGSPLVPDVSRAILTVTEGEEMKKIENAWFKKQTSCPDPSGSLEFSQLDVTSFWVLFVAVVGASFLALTGSMIKFAFLNRHHFRNANSFRKAILALSRQYTHDVNNHPKRRECLCPLSSVDATTNVTTATPAIVAAPAHVSTATTASDPAHVSTATNAPEPASVTISEAILGTSYNIVSPNTNQP